VACGLRKKHPQEEFTMLRTALLFVAGTFALSACAPKAPDTAADEAALQADPLAWFDAYNAGNAEGVAKLYADDGVLMPPGAPAATGPTAIRDFIAADIARSKAAGLTLKNDATTGVGVSGDVGWLSGTFSVTDGSGATVDKGKYLSVYRRASGDWQLIRDTWNSDMAPAPAAPAAAEAAPPPAN
jgi:uncharacterized protein (TIGR02246 family)